MTAPHTFQIPGPPHAKQRPRMTRRGRAYTPAATHNAEGIIKSIYDGPQYDGNVELWIDCFADHSVVTLMDSERVSKLRGDLDNYTKTIMDALNGVAYLDDKQVMELWVAKA